MRVVATFCWTCEKIVQRRFSKRFARCSDLMYCERLATLGLDRLELRRLRFDLIYVYKYFLVWSKQMHQFFFRERNTSTVTHGHSFKLFVPQSRIDVIGLCTVGTACRLSQMIFRH